MDHNHTREERLNNGNAGKRSYEHFKSNNSPGIIAGEVIIFILSFGGLFLNLLVFYILLIRIRILKIDTVLSGLTTIFDMVASITMIVRIIFKWVLVSMGNFRNFRNFCHPTGILFFASTISAFDIVSTLGLIRCLIIVFNFRMRSVYWGLILVILVTFNWAGASAMNWNLPEISWGNFCRASRHEESSIDVFGEIASIKAIVMLIIIIVSYALIFSFYRKYYEHVKRSSSTDQHLIKEISIQKNKTSFKLLILILSYVVIYIPKVIVFVLYNFTTYKTNSAFEMVSSILFSMSTIVNASVLLFIQEETKQELQLIWALLFHRAKSTLK